MFVSLRMLTLSPDRAGERDAIVEVLREAAPRLAGVRGCWVAPMAPAGVINAGHIVWRMTFDSEKEAGAAVLDAVWRDAIAPTLEGAQLIGVGYRVTRKGGEAAGAGLWRALILRVTPKGFPDLVKELEAGLLLFPKYIPAIRRWALSEVATVEGAKAFTHVWEQEFVDLDGLTGEYMNAPIHWGYVDAFFDADYPQYIVDPYLVQVAGEIDRSVI